MNSNPAMHTKFVLFTVVLMSGLDVFLSGVYRLTFNFQMEIFKIVV